MGIIPSWEGRDCQHIRDMGDHYVLWRITSLSYEHHSKFSPYESEICLHKNTPVNWWRDNDFFMRDISQFAMMHVLRP